MLWVSACIYMDDVIVFSHTVEEHHVNLHELAANFNCDRVVLHTSKCEFYHAEVEFLSYILNAEGLQVCPLRVESVLNIAIPEDCKQL